MRHGHDMAKHSRFVCPDETIFSSVWRIDKFIADSCSVQASTTSKLKKTIFLQYKKIVCHDSQLGAFGCINISILIFSYTTLSNDVSLLCSYASLWKAEQGIEMNYDRHPKLGDGSVFCMLRHRSSLHLHLH